MCKLTQKSIRAISMTKFYYNFGAHAFSSIKDNICKITKINFIIMATELAENAYNNNHVFNNPRAIIEPFCKENNIDITKILFICHIGSESYSKIFDSSNLDIYVLFKFKYIGNKLDMIKARKSFRKKEMEIIFEKASNSDLETLEKEFNLFPL